MAKSKKKRTKVYSGQDAKNVRPQVIRISAENRSAPNQWLYERRRYRRPAGIALIVILVLVLLIFGIISLFS